MKLTADANWERSWDDCRSQPPTLHCCHLKTTFCSDWNNQLYTKSVTNIYSLLTSTTVFVPLFINSKDFPDKAISVLALLVRFKIATKYKEQFESTTAWKVVELVGLQIFRRNLRHKTPLQRKQFTPINEHNMKQSRMTWHPRVLTQTHLSVSTISSTTSTC